MSEPLDESSSTNKDGLAESSSGAGSPPLAVNAKHVTENCEQKKHLESSSASLDPHDSLCQRKQETGAVEQTAVTQESPSGNAHKTVTIRDDVTHSVANASQLKAKAARLKRKPSRYQDCTFDVSPKLINRKTSPEACLRKASTLKAKAAINKNTASITQLPRAVYRASPVFCPETAGKAVTFDKEGNFKFKVCGEHTVRSKSGGMTSYRCDICDMLFPRSFSLKRHYERIHINPRFIRNKGKKDKEIIKNLVKKGVDNSPANDPDEQDPCGDAEDKFEVEDGSNAKEQDISDEATPTKNDGDGNSSFFLYACKLCSRQKLFFKRKDELRRHHQAKHGNLVRKKMNVFKCDSCDRTYPTRHELRRHRRTHSGERPYACRFCAKRFPTSTNARRHERTHSGHHSHHCKMCQKSFVQKTDLVKHLRSVHKMKVTKTKAERAGRKDRVSGKVPESAIVSSASSNVQSPVVDKSNTFEENIDFAAYLNLDRFEKGSLMGGQVLEAPPAVQNRRLPDAVGEGEESHRGGDDSGSTDVAKTISSATAVTVGDDGKPQRVHKCSECPKSFTSQVNLRRHFRLKHERNQVVRSSMPVSMVVEKFKIQDALDVEEQDQKNESPEQANSTLSEVLPSAGEEVPCVTVPMAPVPLAPAAPETLTADAKNDHGQNNNSNSLIGKSITGAVLPPKASSSKPQGSKLSSILQKLSSRQDSVLSKVQTLPTSPAVNNADGAESKSILSSVLESPRRANKRKFVATPRTSIIERPAENDRSPADHARLVDKRLKATSDSSAWTMVQRGVNSSDNRLRATQADVINFPITGNWTVQAGGHKNKVQSHAPMLDNRAASHPKRYNIEPDWMTLIQSAPQRGVLPKSGRDRSQHCDVTYTLAQPNHRSKLSSRLASGFDHLSPERQRQWRSRERKMDAVSAFATARNKPVSLSYTVHHMPDSSLNTAGSIFVPAGKPPKPSFVTRPSSVSRRAPIDNSSRPPPRSVTEAAPVAPSLCEETPLDLRHPSKKPTPDYVMTDDGVLDFSKKTRDSISDTKLPGDPPSTTPTFGPLSLAKAKTTRALPVTSNSRLPLGGAPPPKPHINKHHSFGNLHGSLTASVPLKFHDVKFHKGRQVDGAGTAGRPLSLGRQNRAPRPREQRFVASLGSLRNSPDATPPFRGTVQSVKNDRAVYAVPKKLGSVPFGYESFDPVAMRSNAPNTKKRQKPLFAPNIRDVASLSMGYDAPVAQYPVLAFDQSPYGVQSPTFPSQSRGRHSSAGSAPRHQLEGATRRYQRRNGASKKDAVTKRATDQDKTASNVSISADLEKDFMMRCIRKAQYELKLRTAAAASRHGGANAPENPKGHFTPKNSDVLQRQSTKKSELPAKNGREPMASTSGLQLHDAAVGRASLPLSVGRIPALISDEAHALRTEKVDDEIAKPLGAEEGKGSPGPRSTVVNRDRLTMTPGFDTNGEDSSRDDDDVEHSGKIFPPQAPADPPSCPEPSIQSRVIQETKRGREEAENDHPSNVTEKDNEDSNPKIATLDSVQEATLTENMCQSPHVKTERSVPCPPQGGVSEPTTSDQNAAEGADTTSTNIALASLAETSAPETLVEASMSERQEQDILPLVDEQPAEEMQQESRMRVDETDIKETNLSTVDDVSAALLRETNLCKEASQSDAAKEKVQEITEEVDTATSGSDVKGAAEEDIEPSRKCVQKLKLKLRAIKSQEKDGALGRKWTLVENVPVVPAPPANPVESEGIDRKQPIEIRCPLCSEMIAEDHKNHVMQCSQSKTSPTDNKSKSPARPVICESSKHETKVGETLHHETNVCESSHHEIKIKETPHHETEASESSHREAKINKTPHHEIKIKETPHHETVTPGSSYREAKIKDTPHHETEVCESSYREAKIKDTPHHETEVCESSYREAKIKDTPHHETEVCESSYREAKIKDTPHHETEVCESSYREAKIKETPHHETEVCESSYREAKMKETLHHETEASESSHHEIKVKESPRYETEASESSQDKAKVNETPRHETNVCESSQREPKVNESLHHETEISETPHHKMEVGDNSHREAKVKETLHHEMETSEISHREATIKETLHHETETSEISHREATVNETSHHETEVCESSHRETEVRETPHRDMEISERLQHETKVNVTPHHKTKVNEPPHCEMEINEIPHHKTEVSETPRRDMEATTKSLEELKEPSVKSKPKRSRPRIHIATKQETELIEDHPPIVETNSKRGIQKNLLRLNQDLSRTFVDPFLILLDRETSYIAMGALQTEQQVMRTLRYEKKNLLKSQQEEAAASTPAAQLKPNTGASTQDSAHFGNGDVAVVTVEPVSKINAKETDVKDSQNYVIVGKSPAAPAALTKKNSSVDDSSKQSSNIKSEVTREFKGHIGVTKEKQPTGNVRNATRRSNTTDTLHSALPLPAKKPKPATSKSKAKSGHDVLSKIGTASIDAADDTRRMRTRSAAPDSAVGAQLKPKPGSKPAPGSRVHSVATVVATATVENTKDPKSSMAKSLKAKIDLRKILPPVSVPAKRPASSSVVSAKRRSIRKYSKDVLKQK